MTHADNVPVTMNGKVIGTASVNRDGTIDMTLLTPPSDLGKELLAQLSAGLTRGLSIAPVMVPAVNGMDAHRDYIIPDTEVLHFSHYYGNLGNHYLGP